MGVFVFFNPNFSLDLLKVDGKHTCSLTARNSEYNVYDKYLWPALFFIFFFIFCRPRPFCFDIIVLLCFVFRLARRELYGGSVIVTSHTTNTYLKGVFISKPVFGGYNPFEMHLSVITHRQGWSPAWLWGATLPRCLAHTLTPPGLQQGLHAGILVSPLLYVPTNYLLKDKCERFNFIGVSVTAFSITSTYWPLATPLTTWWPRRRSLTVSPHISPSPERI